MQELRVKQFSSSPSQFQLHLLPLWDYISSLFFGVSEERKHVIISSHTHKVVGATQKSAAQKLARLTNEKYRVEEIKEGKPPKTCLVLKQFSLLLNHFGWRKYTLSSTESCTTLTSGQENGKVWPVR